MSEQPTTPPVRRWFDHPDVDGPIPPAEPYQPAPRTRIGQALRTVGSLEAGERRVAAFEALDQAAREQLNAHARAVHRSIEAAMLPTSAPPAPPPPAPRPSWFARAIGWFRR